MFSQRHYKAIARVLWRRTDVDSGVTEGSWRQLANDLADMFEQDSKKFDRSRFLDAARTGHGL